MRTRDAALGAHAVGLSRDAGAALKDRAALKGCAAEFCNQCSSVVFSVFLWLAFLLWPTAATAQRLELSVSPISITFPSADPDVTPIIPAAPIVVTIRIRQNPGTPWQLTALADGDLMSGSETVDITNVTWGATPAPPFQNGTLSKTVAQRIAAGSGNVNPGQNGSLTFRLANSWNYSAGTYSQTIIFTLSAP